MTQYIEKYVPVVQQAGLNTQKAVSFESTFAVTGASTLTGAVSAGSTLAVTGAVTLSSTLAVTGAITASAGVKGPRSVISGSGATVTLTAAQSGSLVLFDRAAGITFTLPAPVAGLHFEFLVLTTITSNAAKIITDAGTTLLNGSMLTIATDNSNAVAAWVGNGSSHIAVSMNGTTTGGYAGARFTATCVSSTLWTIQGTTNATSTVATPFSAS